MDEMDYRCGKGPRTGDKGQRYEVRATAVETGKPMVIGWTNAPDGGGLARGARLWPHVRDVVVVDRQAARIPTAEQLEAAGACTHIVLANRSYSTLLEAFPEEKRIELHPHADVDEIGCALCGVTVPVPR